METTDENQTALIKITSLLLVGLSTFLDALARQENPTLLIRSVAIWTSHFVTFVTSVTSVNAVTSVSVMPITSVASLTSVTSLSVGNVCHSSQHQSVPSRQSCPFNHFCHFHHFLNSIHSQTVFLYIFLYLRRTQTNLILKFLGVQG